MARIGHDCLICGSDGAADAILNALLFLPLGMALAAAGLRSRLVLLTLFVLSTAIEVAQLGIPGRYSNLGDVVFNTGGGFAGSVLIAHATGLRAWSRRHRSAIAAATVALPIAVAAASAWLLLPGLQRAKYYGQWTADLGDALGVYEGHVLSARIGAQAAPSRPLKDSPAARRSILAGDTITVIAVAGPPPPRLSPVFSIYDGERREVLLLGAVGSDIVLRIRRNAARLRFDQPDLRWRGALRGVGAGDTVRMSVWRAGRWTFCLELKARVRCTRSGAGRGWALLLAPGDAPAALTSAADIAWIGGGVALLLFGIGLWTGAGLRWPALHSRESRRR